jgi:hypothetical protein
MAGKKRVRKKEADKPAPFDACYVCQRYVGASGERDHFPVSHAEGGECVLTICTPCHDLKDRVTLDSWDADLAFNALSGLWLKATPEERLWIIKIFHICSMQSATIEELVDNSSGVDP